MGGKYKWILPKNVVVVNILVSFTSKKYNFTINIGHRFLI